MPTTTVQAKPRMPSLADLFAAGGKSLTATFQAYDEAMRRYVDDKEMAERFAGSPLPVSTGPLLTASQREARGTASNGTLPNAGWAFYDYEARIGDGSRRLRPQSTGISIQPTEFKMSWTELGLVRGWFSGSNFQWDRYVEYYSSSPSALNHLAPRTFVIEFNETPTTEGYRVDGRLHLRVSMIPGGVIVSGGTTYPAVTEAVRIVTRRAAPGRYIAWLESAETVDPTPVAELHVGAIFAEAI